MLVMATTIAAAMLPSGRASGVQPVMTPVSQMRTTSAFVIVPPCGSPASVAANDAAIGFEPFDSASAASRECAAAQAHAFGSQNSTIEVTVMTASGATAIDAAAMPIATIHSIAGSIFEVTFDVDEPGRFRLTAALSASGAPPVRYSAAGLSVLNAAQNVLFGATLTAPLDGTTVIADTFHTLRLETGRYTLRASAQSFIDATVPPSGSGSAHYGLLFESLLHGDVNGDGTVDVTDLLLLLEAWGSCEGRARPPTRNRARPT
jgi:hypothetical protein